MRTSRLALASALAAFAALPLVAERQPFERYQSIVDRQMFGPLPPGFDPTKPPSEVSRNGSRTEKELTKEQEKIKSAIHFSMINVTPEGATAVGFTDKSDSKNPVHYYLKVGEKNPKWTVKEANAADESMTIVSADGVEVSLRIGGDSSKDGGSKGAAAAPSNAGGASAPEPRGGLLGGRFPNRGLRGGGIPLGNSLSSRRRQRLAEEQARQAAEAAKKAEEQAQRDEEKARQEQIQAEEKARREEEREKMSNELKSIQEQLRKAREEREASNKAGESEDGGNAAE